MATTESDIPNVEETLAWEAEQAPRAGIAAIVAGLCTLGGGLAAAAVYRDFPRVPLVNALRDALGEKLPSGTGLKTPQILFYDDKMVPLILVSIVLAIGAAAIALPLLYLYRATAARRPQLPRIALYAALLGPVLLALSELLLQGVVSKLAHDFANSADHSSTAAHDALRSPLLVAAQVMRQLAVLALGLAFVMVSLNAMRVGLLSRFMGILGIIVGVLFVIPVGSQLPIVQSFWLVAIGMLFLGRWPSGSPPAWETGRAEPWPSQQEVREARQRQAKGPGAVAAPPDPDGADESGPAGEAHPASKKRKRKRR
jgi:hypothetical protein